jgi:hypothetical protein
VFWRTSSKARTRQALFHTPLPCFLEVLILHDFKSFAPEVLILGDFKSLLPEVLILVEFKWRLLSEMWKIEIFLEVLILGELGDAKCRNGGIFRLRERFGATGSDCDRCKPRRGRADDAWRATSVETREVNDEGARLQDTLNDSTKGNVMSRLSMSYSKRCGERTPRNGLP